MTLLRKLPFDWKQRAVLQGRGFHMDIGAFSTPIAGDTTVIDIDRPVGYVSVPTGTSIFPIRITAQTLLPLVATDADEAEILVGVDIAAAADASGTHTDETALKMYLGQGTSLCTCVSAQTDDMTVAPVLGMELARAHTAAEIVSAAGTFWSRLELLYEPDTPPVLVGPCALYIYWGGTVAVSGFAQIEWLEYKTAEL